MWIEPASVAGYVVLLGEALNNLVHNAIEYLPAPGHITVRTGARDGAAFMEVEDDGPGIPAPERARVLERFYRIPGTAGTGSGLGLAIVQRIIAEHQGKIQAVPNQPNGAKFIIELPTNA